MEMNIAYGDLLKVQVKPCLGVSQARLVLLHGWGTDSRCWGDDFIAKARMVFDIYCIDLPGFGENAFVREYQIDDIVKLIDMAIPERCVLVGWSLGGMVATRVAAISSKVTHLVTLASNASFVAKPDWPTGMDCSTFSEFLVGFEKQPEATLSKFYALQALGDEQRRKVSSSLKSIQSYSSEQYLSWKSALDLLASVDNRQALAQMKIPALYLYGERDSLVPAATAKVLKQLNTSCQVSVLEKVGHALHISQPEKVVGLIQRFLGGQEKFSKRDVAGSFSEAANRYDEWAHLQRHVLAQLAKRSCSKESHGPIADLGCGTGAGLTLLRSRYPNKLLIGLDIAPGMLQKSRQKMGDASLIQGDLEFLPFSDDSIGLLFSSLTLQWSQHLSAFFKEAFRVLKPGASLCFSTLGPRTLHELRESWRWVDRSQHVNEFLSCEDVQNMALEAGFCDLQSEEEYRVLEYPSVIALMKELKGIGAHNMNHERPKGLTSPRRLQMLVKAYEKNFGREGVIPASYEIHYFQMVKA